MWLAAGGRAVSRAARWRCWVGLAGAGGALQGLVSVDCCLVYVSLSLMSSLVCYRPITDGFPSAVEEQISSSCPCLMAITEALPPCLTWCSDMVSWEPGAVEYWYRGSIPSAVTSTSTYEGKLLLPIYFCTLKLQLFSQRVMFPFCIS